MERPTLSRQRLVSENSTTSDPPVVTSSTKKIRTSVLIDETQNTIRHIPNNNDDTSISNGTTTSIGTDDTVVVSSHAWNLLEEAERRRRRRQLPNTNASKGLLLEVISISTVQHAITSLRKAYETNQKLRTKYQLLNTIIDDTDSSNNDTTDVSSASATTIKTMTDGYKNCMESEILLYEHIMALKAITIDPIQYYPYIFGGGGKLLDTTVALSTTTVSATSQQQNSILLSDLFVPLLLHPNIDITISVVSLLLEWYDSNIIKDVLERLDQNDNNKNVDTTITTTITTKDKVNVIINLFQHCIDQFFSTGIAEVIVDQCEHMLIEQQKQWSDHHHKSNDVNDDDDDDDEVGRGVEDVLSIFDHLFEWDTTIVEKTIMTNNNTIMTTNRTTTTTVATQICQHTNLVSFLFSLQILQNDKNKVAKEEVDQQQQRFIDLRYRAMELLTAILTHEEIYNHTKCNMDWIHLPPYGGGTGSTNNEKADPLTLDAMDIMLQNIGQYRKRQPNDMNEMEFIENCSIVVTSILTYSSSSISTTTNTSSSSTTSMITAFIERQGIELVQRCLKERVYTGAIILSWLDFSSGSDISHRLAFEYMVQVGIFKYIFPIFMNKHLPKYYDPYENLEASQRNPIKSTKSMHRYKKQKMEYYKKIEMTTIRILYGFVRHLHNDSPNDAKARFIVKFIENDNDTSKLQRLIDLYIKYDQQVRLAEYKFYQSDIEETIRNEHNNVDDNAIQSESIIQLAVMDATLQAGGDILYRLAAIIAFCCCNSKKCHTYIIQQLHNKQSGISVIKDTLQKFISLLDDGTEQRLLLQSFQDQI